MHSDARIFLVSSSTPCAVGGLWGAGYLAVREARADAVRLFLEGAHRGLHEAQVLNDRAQLSGNLCAQLPNYM